MTTIPDDARDIYPMPMFATITTADPQAAGRWYATLGFWELFSMPGPDGLPRMIHLRRLRYQDMLLVADDQAGVASGSGLTVSFAAHDEDLDAIAAAARSNGTGAVEGPTIQPWNSVELRCTDPDGIVVVLTKALNRDADFDEVMGDVRTAQ